MRLQKSHYRGALCGKAFIDARVDGLRYTDFCIPPEAPVAQLDRASGYEPEGRMFESCRAHH